jgi:hypothetical protein
VKRIITIRPGDAVTLDVALTTEVTLDVPETRIRAGRS